MVWGGREKGGNHDGEEGGSRDGEEEVGMRMAWM